MRIGIDCRLWGETGVGRYIRNLVRELQIIDEKNDYVLFVGERFKSEDLGFKNVRWEIVKTDVKWHTVEEQLLLPTVLNNAGVDLVHFTYFSIPIFYNKPYVITIHDLILNHFPTGKASTLPFPLYYIKHFGYKQVMRAAAKKAQKIITVSEATKNEIMDHLPVKSDKIVVIYEGVDERLNSKFKIQNSKFQFKSQKYFLYVGNAYPHKNLERLVEAFSKVEDKDMRLILVGGKDYFYNRLEEKVKKLGLEKSIVFYGYADDKELVALYQNARAVVLPSLMEGFGLPGLEAMHLGSLVLASGIPAFKEIYRDAAVYFNPKDIKSISYTMDAVIKNPEQFDKTKKKGIARTKNFLWKTMAQETLRVYEASSKLNTKYPV